MADAQKGHKSWIERLDHPVGVGAEGSSNPVGGGASTPSSGQGDTPEPGATTWHEYLDSAPQPSPAPLHRPTGDAQPRQEKHGSQGGPGAGPSQQAVPDPNVTELQRRWLFTQAQLLDDPREAVLEAGRLIGDAMRLASDSVEQQRVRIEREWRTDADVGTDELRSVMQRYRGLFQYVLAADELVGEVEVVRREHRAMVASRPPAPAVSAAAPAQAPDGLAEVLHAGRAARIDAETTGHRGPRHQSPATQWIGGLGTAWSRSPKLRWIAGAALLLLVGLPAAYGWWRWQGSASREAARQARALTVEPLRYYWHDQGSGPPGQRAEGEPGGIAGAGTEAVPGTTAAAAGSQQPAATLPPVEEPRVAVDEAAQTSPLPEEQMAIRLSEPEPVIAEPEPTASPVETASLTDEDEAQAEPETLLAEADPSRVEPAQTSAGPAAAPPLEATSTLFQSIDPSEIAPVVGDPESTVTETEPAAQLPEAATAAAEQDAPSAPQAPPPAARQPEPEVAAPTVRRGDLVPLTDPGVARPVLLVEPMAEYPDPARRMRREATVSLRVLVDERGLPSQIQAAGRSAGLGFDEAARAAVARARWRPATKDGVPVKVWIQTAVRFQLDGR